MSRTYGYSKKGLRAYEACKTKPKKSERLTIIAVLGINGLIAPLELNGSLTGISFYTYAKEILLPKLKPGQILILDNLSCHKVSGIKELFEEAKVKIEFLPPYSPDLSPIEEYWSKIKAYLKGKAEREIRQLREALIQSFERVTDSDILGWFKHAQCNIQCL